MGQATPAPRAAPRTLPSLTADAAVNQDGRVYAFTDRCVHAARDVAAALGSNASGRIAWVWIHLPPGAEPRRMLRAAERGRDAAGRPVHMEALQLSGGGDAY